MHDSSREQRAQPLEPEKALLGCEEEHKESNSLVCRSHPASHLTFASPALHILSLAAPRNLTNPILSLPFGGPPSHELVLRLQQPLPPRHATCTEFLLSPPASLRKASS
jgi:hypothetical protein